MAKGEHMQSSDAIAAFLENGGRVVRLQGTLPVTGPEVLEYLGGCGITATYSPGHPRFYLYKGQLVSLSKLVAVANRRRQAEQLPPFVPRARI
jgi:hypothetical protein